MLLIRGLIALGVSAVIATGTLITVNHNSDKAQRTATELQQKSLDFQREAMKAAEDARTGARSAEDVAAEQNKKAEQLVDDANEAAAEIIDDMDDDARIPDAAKAQLEAAKEQLRQ